MFEGMSQTKGEMVGAGTEGTERFEITLPGVSVAQSVKVKCLLLRS